MRKLLLVSILFAVSQICHPTGDWSATAQTEPVAEFRGGEGSRAGGGFHGDGELHQGGGRGGAPGGQWQRGERGERGEREFREHERHEGFERGVLVAPGYYPYYYPYGYYPDPSDQPSEYQGPDFDLYCFDPQGYYPNVVQCNGEWDEVPR